MAVVLGVTAVGVWAVATERVSYVITYGVSMNPVYYKDDLVVVARRSSYGIGDIAAYRDAKSGQRVLHRIIGGSAAGGFVFKGDNNQSVDLPHPTAAQLIGKAALHVPHGGIWLKPLLSPSGLGMIVFLIAGGGTTATLTRRQVPRGRRKKKVKAMSRQAGSWAQAAEVVRILERMPAHVRALAVATAAIAGLALGLGLVGWTKPVTATVAVPPGPAQTTTFSYSARVPPSPAYDGTTVTSPDPVFRRLTDRIDLRTRYEGPPGTFALGAELTNGTGWRTTMALVPAQQFTGSAYQRTVRLDLKALSDRAAAASRATGVGVGNPIAIELRSLVSSAGIAPFTATTRFEMNDVQLIVVAGSSLSSSAGATPATTVQAREVAIFGHQVMNASTARSYAILAFLTAMAGALLIYLRTRRNEPPRTRAEIERRHQHLLVHVEPMNSPPGKPVVNVDSFPALVKLAERYGQMILTWRRPDADDFVVRDEGITYRYRVPLDEPVLQNVEHIKRPNSAGTHRRKTSSSVT
ncbi:hypothetical protein JKJ07_11795 [Actinoplanes sp. LDG1-01]|uniref:Signal peptidase I n=1 Tax=Paractinoplanes lichenicola TaxID=2802976 RepID=A0ABS1VJV0_9ACTN|nr:hypothetical protein [Actinoplanes lichenicola]